MQRPTDSCDTNGARPAPTEPLLAALHAAISRPANDVSERDVRLILMDGQEQHVLDMTADPAAFAVLGADMAISEERVGRRRALVIATPSPEPLAIDVNVVLLDANQDACARVYELSQDLAGQASALALGEWVLAVVCSQQLKVHMAVHVARSGGALQATSDQVPDDPIQLRVQLGHQVIRCGLREPWLAEGVVLGRACGLFPGSPGISRMHLLLRREGRDVVFYDLRSVGGMLVSGERVRRVVIPAPVSDANGTEERPGRLPAINPGGTVLELPKGLHVTITDDSADVRPGDTFEGVMEIVSHTADRPSIIATLWWDGRRVRSSPAGYVDNIMRSVRLIGPEGRMLTPACGPEFLRWLPAMVSNGYTVARHVMRDPPSG